MGGTKLTRRTLLAGMAAAPFADAACAQTDWPSHSLRVIVPYPPAGGADTTARILYARLGDMLHQQFIVDNHGGAGGTIGEAIVAKAAPDGYTILHDATAFSVNSALYPSLPFDYNKDFDPVVLVSLVPNILVVTPSEPVNTVADVIARAKASPDGITMASSGNGTLQHLCLEMFRHVTGIKINHVPYRGGGVALTDVMSGQVKYFFSNGSSVVGLIKGGKVKAVAHTGHEPPLYHRVLFSHVGGDFLARLTDDLKASHKRPLQRVVVQKLGLGERCPGRYEIGRLFQDMAEILKRRG